MWRKASRPAGPMRPVLVNGVPHIHAARVFEILGDHAPDKRTGHHETQRLLKKAEHDPDFQLHAVNLGRRYVWPEWEVLELKARLEARHSPQP